MPGSRRISRAIDRISSIAMAAAMALFGEWVLVTAFAFEIVLSFLVSRVEVKPPDEGVSGSLARRLLREAFHHLCEERLLGLFRLGLMAVAVVQIALNLGMINAAIHLVLCLAVLAYVAARYLSFVKINHRLLGRRLLETRHGSTVLPKG
ncbi:MAG: hypothetical protein N3A38_13970 [Planctomycetota bacterium]|nr:hypothetical protein [Planctomycetota bacterium]